METIVVSGWQLATQAMEYAGNFLTWITVAFSSLALIIRISNWRQPTRFIRVGWSALTLIMFTATGLIAKYIVYDELGLSQNGFIYPISDGMVGVSLLLSLILQFVALVIPPLGKKKAKAEQFFCPKCKREVIKEASVCPHCNELIKVNWNAKKS